MDAENSIFHIDHKIDEVAYEFRIYKHPYAIARAVVMSKSKNDLISALTVVDFGFEKLLLQGYDRESWFPRSEFGKYIGGVESLLEDMDFDTGLCIDVPNILLDYEIEKAGGGDGSPVEFDKVFGNIGYNLEAIDEFIDWCGDGRSPKEICTVNNWEDAKLILEDYLTSGNRQFGCDGLYSLYAEFMENYVWTQKRR
jgi:hypothetical protein